MKCERINDSNVYSKIVSIIGNERSTSFLSNAIANPVFKNKRKKILKCSQASTSNGKENTTQKPSTHKPQIGGKVALKFQPVNVMHLNYHIPFFIAGNWPCSPWHSHVIPTNSPSSLSITQTTHPSLTLIILSPNPKKLSEINKTQSGRFPLSQQLLCLFNCE